MSSAKAAYPQLKLNVTCNLVDDEKNQSRKRLLYDWIQTLDAVWLFVLVPELLLHNTR